MSGKTGEKKRPAAASKRPMKKRRNWSHEETRGLIAIWGSEKHQEGFEGMKYNSRVWAAITTEFLARFPESPYNKWENIKERIEYLRKKYRLAKKENSKSGRGRVSSPFYDDMDEILGKRPMNNVKAYHHMDAGISSDEDDPTTSIAAPSAADDEIDQDTLDSSTNPEPDLSQDSDVDMLDEDNLTISPEPPSSPDDSIDEPAPAEEDIPGPSNGTKRKQGKQGGTVPRKRRGKRSQIEDAVDKAMTKLIDFQQQQQNESTATLLQLERDRFAWEQQQEDERTQRECQWKQDQLELEERKMKNNSEILMQFLSVLGTMGQGGNQSQNVHRPPAGQPHTHPALSPIPPYVDHSSFGNETSPTFWQDTRRM